VRTAWRPTFERIYSDDDTHSLARAFAFTQVDVPFPKKKAIGSMGAAVVNARKNLLQGFLDKVAGHSGMGKHKLVQDFFAHRPGADPPKPAPGSRADSRRASSTKVTSSTHDHKHRRALPRARSRVHALPPSHPHPFTENLARSHITLPSVPLHFSGADCCREQANSRRWGRKGGGSWINA
jgi:hypothetical protein